MLVLNLPFKALMFLTLMRPSLVLFLVLWLKLVKDFLKVRCRLALLPFLISCLIWLDLVASLPLIKERILVIILLLHFLYQRQTFHQVQPNQATSAVSDKLLDLVGLGGKSAADKGKDTRDYLAAAFP